MRNRDCWSRLEAGGAITGSSCTMMVSQRWHWEVARLLVSGIAGLESRSHDPPAQGCLRFCYAISAPCSSGFPWSEKRLSRYNGLLCEGLPRVTPHLLMSNVFRTRETRREGGHHV
ncbi:hypothetical protein JTE90_018949 [Oedothorax gibbosus]|uniref:Uncharacterized protein n=1 Tax=Oedothorax gibbosus TaxID=931172 RepID=A0AAV6TJI8_9ARAC|nr:hypothetical protein JTE90_018949 [Oedothorax gibbosus]